LRYQRRPMLLIEAGVQAGRQSVLQVVAMRETFGHHFDLVVVIWVLALVVGWSMVTLSKANLSADQWSSPPQSGPAWVIPSGGPAQ